MKTALTLLTPLLLAPVAALHAAEPPATFCNPLPIPNYPVGFYARNVTNGEPDARESWILGHREQFRELAEAAGRGQPDGVSFGVWGASITGSLLAV